MELHPILEKSNKVSPRMWYVLSGIGDSPTMRVGHSCIFVPGKSSVDGAVFVIGGANPDGSFADVYTLSLETFSWDVIDAAGMKARYEHCSFLPQSNPSQVYIFGGADQSHNFNDVQVFDTLKSTWQSLEPRGNKPTPRTYHVSASSSDLLYVYSGGQSGSDPVGDRQVHTLNTRTNEWTTLNTRGEPPKPRHGHVVLAVGQSLYIHGGMAGTTFYDDVHVLNLDRLEWTSVKKKRKCWPSGRAGHGGVTLDKVIFIFGGMNREGALDELYRFDTVSEQWNKMESDGPPPAPRLDFGYCVVRLRVADTKGSIAGDGFMAASQQAQQALEGLRIGSAGSASRAHVDEQPAAAAAAPEGGESWKKEGEESLSESPRSASGVTNTFVMDLLLVHGGMDTEGQIYDDCLVYLLASSVEHDQCSSSNE